MGTRRQYAVKRADLMLNAAEFRLDMHSSQEFGNPKGLGDIVHGTRLEPGKDLVRPGLGSDEDNGNILDGWVRFEPPADFNPIHSGHEDVQQD